MTNNYIVKLKSRLAGMLSYFMLMSLAVMLFSPTSDVVAQTASLYSFSTTTGSSLDPMTGATTLLTTGNDDTPTAASSSIGFNFVFEGTTYTTFWTSPDGWIQLGGASSASQFSNAITSTTNIPKIFPYWDDMATGTTGYAKSVVTGLPGSQILKIEWFVTIPRATGGAANSTFQLWLYEGTNSIEFRYGTMGAGVMSASVGIRGAQAVAPFAFQSVTVSTNVTSNSVENNGVSDQPASGRQYTFNPPAPCVTPTNQPTAFTATGVSPSAATGSFTAAPGSDSYLVVRGASGFTPTAPSDGVNYAPGAALGTGTVVGLIGATSFTASGLTLSTTYDFYIYSANSSCSGGPLYLAGSPAFASATTTAFISATLGGLWSSPATWGGAVPTATDDVVIPNGIIITVDQVSTARNITVDGILQWNATSNAMTITGNLSVGATGRFLPHTSSGASVTINLAGDLTNSGLVNFAPSALNLNGVGTTQNLSGAGTFVGTAGGKGIIRALLWANTGTLNVNTSQSLVATTTFAAGAGTVNTNSKLEVDNTAQVFGQSLNNQVLNLIVTNMGSAYTAAPVVAPNGAAVWAASTAVSVGNIRVYNGNVFAVIKAGTTDALPPTGTGPGKEINGTASLLWVGNTGTIGNALIATVVAGTQYFYNGNLYTCTVGGLIDTTTVTYPSCNTPGSTCTSGAATFAYVGSPATASVNFDVTTGTCRSLTLTNSGSGYQITAPAYTILSSNGVGTGAAGAAYVPVSIAGQTSATIQKSAVASIVGTNPINSSQGVGSVFVTNGGRYNTAPTVGFGGPTGINFVTNSGSGYAAAPTVTFTGGTILSGTNTFTVVVAGGKVLNIQLSTSAIYSVPPTGISIVGGTNTATAAIPAGCWAQATSSLNANGQISSFTISQAGFGYTTAPTVGLSGAVAGETAAAGPACRVGLFTLVPGFFSPAASNAAHNETNLAGCIPTNRRFQSLTLSAGTLGLNFSGNVTIYGTGSLTLLGGPIDMGGNTLEYEAPGFFGQSSAAASWVQNGSIILNSVSTGTLTRTFPFRASGATGAVQLNVGSGTLAAGSDIKKIRVTQLGAPTGTATGVTSNMGGTRSYQVDILTASVTDGTQFGTNPTMLNGFDGSDNLIADNATLFLCQSNTGISSGWAVRSAAGTAGSLPATGTRTSATTGNGPIVFASTMYFGWSSTYTPPPALNYAVTRTTGNTYQSIAPVLVGGDGTGTLSTAAGDEGVQALINIAATGFTYQGSPVTAMAIHTNGLISLNNGFYTYTTASNWDNSLSGGGNGFNGTSDFNKRNCLAPFYDDLNKPTPVIYYKIGGGKVTVEWFNTTFFGLAGPQLYYQVVLDSSDQSITFNYGDMQLYNGTQNVRYSYTCGINGAFVQAVPQAGQIMQQQFENTASFTHENGLVANWGANGLAISPEPHSSIKFTPGTYVPLAAPTPTPPANDEAGSAFVVPALTAFPSNIAWDYLNNQSNLYTTRNATFSNYVATCNGKPAKDVWFTFNATDPNTTVRIYGSGGFIPRVEVYDFTLSVLSPVVCATGTQGLIANAVMTGLNPGDDYYVRVYHDSVGVQATATATVSGGSVTGLSFTNGTNYSIPKAAFGYNAPNQGPIITFSGGGGSGAAAAWTNPTSTTNSIVSNLTGTNIGFTGGTGYTSAPTVTIESPDWGVTGEFGIIVFAKASNDECATAINLTNLLNANCVAGQNARNGVATSAASASAEASCSGTPDDDVWYSFTAVDTLTFVSVSGVLGFDPVFQVFDGGVSPGNCGTKTTTAFCINSSGLDGTESSSVTTVVGNTYYVRVYDAAAGSGTAGSSFNICVTSARPTCVTAPVAPVNGGNACTGPVTLSWNVKTDATGYNVYLDPGAGPATTLVANNVSNTDTTYTSVSLAAGTYSWRVEPFNAVGNAAGCTDFSFTTIAPDTITFTTNPPGAAYCAGSGGSVEITASGSGNYTWTPATALDVTTGPVVNANPTASTTYTVSGYTTAGCVATASQVVTVNYTPTAPTTTGFNICVGGTIPSGQGLTANCVGGEASYSTTVAISNPTTDEDNGLSGTAGFICPGNNLIASFVIPPIPAGAVITGAHFAMNGVTSGFPGEAVLHFGGTAISGISPCFEGTSGFASPFIWNISADGTIPSDTVALAALINPAGGTIEIRYSESFNDNTAGPDAVFPATGTFQFYYSLPSSTVSWYANPTGGTALASGSPFDPGVNSPAGTITYYARCATAFCESTSSPADLVIGDPLLVNLSATPNDSVCGGTNVTVSATASGGGAPYSYLWSTGDTTSSVSATLFADSTFSVTVTDNCGNSTPASLTFEVIAAPPVAVTASSNKSCSTAPTPSITLTASGASSYSWTPSTFLSATTGTSVNALNVNTTTTYVVTGYDSTTGCTASASTTIQSGSPLSISASATPSLICNLGSSQLNAVANGLSGNLLITEVTLFRTGTGASSYPAFVTGQDFVEITNISSSSIDISGFTFADYPSSSSVASHPYTFLPGTIVPAGGVLVVHMGAGTDDPANRYYNTGGISDNWFSGGLMGVVIKSGSAVIDAVGVNSGYVFDPGTGVTATDFSGFAPSAGGFAGPRRTALNDSNTGADWTESNATTNIQNIGTSNGAFNAPPPPVIVYSWTPATFLNSTTISNPLASLVTGDTTTYTVTATDTIGGCSVSAQVSIYISALSALTLNPASPTICEGQSVTISSSISGGGLPYSYLWSTGSTTDTIVVSPTTTTVYTLTLTDNCGSTATMTDTVFVNPAPIISVTPPTGISCSTSPSTITLTASGNSDTYSWSPTVGLDVSAGAVVNATAIVTTTYIVTGTITATGCTASASSTITSGAAVVATASATDTSLCAGGSTTLNATGSLLSLGNYSISNIAYSAPTPTSPTTVTPWTNTGTDDGSNGPILLPFPFTFYGNTYNQIYVGTNGYISFSDLSTVSAANLRVPQTYPNATVPNNMVSLGMSDLDVLAPGSVSYWTSGSDFVISFDQIQEFANAANTITGYIILHSADNTIDILVNNSSIADAHTLGIENSTGTVGDAPAGRNNLLWTVSTPEAYRFTPPTSVFSPVYSWSPGAGLSDSTIANPTIASVPTGDNVYTVTVYDPAGGCSSTASVTIHAIAPPQPQVTPGNATICASPDFWVHVVDAGPYSGGYPSGTIVNWLGIQNGLSPNDSINATLGGTYFIAEVTVNVNGGTCTATSDTVTINVNLVTASSVISPATCGNANGQIVATVTQGLAPYRYVWTDGVITLRDVTSASTTDSLENLTAGTYFLTVYDNEGGVVIGQPSCNSGALPFTVANQNGPDAEIVSSTNITCFGLTDGTATADATGGVQPYSFLWSTTETTPAISNLGAGTYIVTVTDANGCTDTAQVTIVEPSVIEISVSVTNVAVCGDSTGSATATATGGTPGYLYEFFDKNLSSMGAASTNPTFTGLYADTFYVQVTDTNNCSNFIQFEITQVCDVTVNLKVYLEGYASSFGAPLLPMSPGLFLQGVSASDAIADTIQVDLRDPFSSATVIETAYALIDTGGNATLTYSSAVNGGTYWLSVIHRSSVETFSGSPITLSGSNSYNFTTSDTMSYGPNMKDVFTDGTTWAMYSGDIFSFDTFAEGQDGFIDIFDFLLLDTDVQAGVSGYYRTDLNGDGFVDIFDFLILDPNIQAGISKLTPP